MPTAPPGSPARREYLLVLLAGAVGAAVVLLSARQPWAHVTIAAAGPLPAAAVPVSGQDLVPATGALGLAALAGMAAVIATRGIPRRVVGGLLVIFGLTIAVTVALHVGAHEVLAAAHSAAVSQAGSVISGGSGISPGSFGGGAPGVTETGRVIMSGVPWRVLAAAGGLAVAAAGVLTAWRGTTWPGMSARYDRPAAGAAAAARTGSGDSAAARPPGPDPAGMWEQLSRGVDPTASRPD
ncbi:MAG TPA: Trp biosynthesis-associated membrane protein [Streptosporangiaceae bacterium]|nr:Trp biosynthesis-associated membrane protein [Streptosporangiaceae bacterium]